ncbi:MAG: YlxR family protein [Chloroflexi bacterium]|nr:YlxR family protein [Chloroflexota bacterium]
MSPRRPKKVPQRTCVGCRTVRAKRDLIRIVRTVDGTVVIDPTGKRSGRGAYLCRQRTCWDVALQRGALERALKQAIPPESRAALVQFATGLPTSLSEAPAGSV